MTSFYKKFLTFSVILSASLFADENYDLALKHYLEGDYEKSKEAMEKSEVLDDEKVRFKDFVIATIYAYQGGKVGDILKLFESCFKNPPKNQEVKLASVFARFANANKLYAKSLEYLNLLPDFEDKILYQNSMLAWYYALANLNCGNEEKSLKILSTIWDKFSEDFNDDSCDLIAFEKSTKQENIANFTLTKAQFESVKNLTAKFRAAIINSTPIPEIKPEDLGKLSVAQLLYLSKINANDFAIFALQDRAMLQENSVYSPKALLYLAEKKFAEKSYEDAILLCEDSLKLTPPNILDTYPALMLKGDILRMQGKYDDSRKVYLEIALSKVLKGVPLAESLYKLGICWYEEKNYLNAHSYFERVYVVYFPFDYWASRAYLYDAKSLMFLEYHTDAKKVLREYLRRSKFRENAIYKEAKNLLDSMQ